MELQIFVRPLHRTFLQWDYQGHADQGSLRCPTLGLLAGLSGSSSR